jgi:hypothetical protein
VNQRKDVRSKRSGSENRQRQHGVNVRFSEGELGFLDETVKSMGMSRAALLRNAALVAADLHKALGCAEQIIENRDREIGVLRNQLAALEVSP